MGLFDFFKKKEEVSRADLYRQSLANRETAAKPIDMSGSAVMPIDDVFAITGRGIVATGNIKKGSFSTGDQVTILRADGTSITSTITGIEMFRKIMDTAQTGENVGLLLQDVTKNQMSSGDVVKKM